METYETDSYTVDPRYEEEVSGCTASVGIVSAKKIYVVSDVSVALVLTNADFIGQCWRLPQRSRCKGSR